MYCAIIGTITTRDDEEDDDIHDGQKHWGVKWFFYCSMRENFRDTVADNKLPDATWMRRHLLKRVNSMWNKAFLSS